MSVTFSLYDTATKTYLGSPANDPNFHNAGAGMVADALDLHTLSHDNYVWAGGSCTVKTFRDRLLRWPDGHPDPEIQGRLTQLAELVLSAPADIPTLTVTWG